MPSNYLARYELLEEIGRGNMGVVYKARDPEIDRILAIKVVRLGFSLDDAQRKTFMERFRREARIAGNLLHPHIVGVYDIDFSGDEPFIAMEYFEGISLSQLIDRELSNVDEVRLIIRQLASALDYAHREGVIHRDIKPANVLYQPGPMIKLVDFGIAKVDALEPTETGDFIGTPSYMSPEIFSGDSVDGRSDLFSLGVVLYQLLTGKRPFEAETVSRTIYRVLHEEPTPPSELREGLSLQWDIVCARLLEKKPEHRYRSAAILMDDLDALAQGSLIAQEPTQPRESLKTPWERSRLLVPLLLSLMALAGLGLFWPFPNSEVLTDPTERNASMSALFASARQKFDDGLIEESEALLSAVVAHRPDYPGSEVLRDDLDRARFRKTLPRRFVARHEHRVGHCTGDLLLREDGIVLESRRHGTWHWHADEIERLRRGGDDTLTLQVASENYNLTFIRPPLAKQDYESYRLVLDAVRLGEATTSE